MAPPPFADAIRGSAPDRYISLLYAPAERRAALAALYTFDAEIAGIRARVREAMAGEIRLQWWRDAIAVGTPTGSPLADALIDAIRLHDLPLPAFDNMLEARVFDLYDDAMPSRTDLEGYLGETEGAVIQLAALILDREAATAHAALAGHAGCARGIATLLGRVAREGAKAENFVPRDLLSGVGAGAVTGAGEDGARRALGALGREHFQAFRRDAANLPATLRPAFLPLAVVAAALALPLAAGLAAPAVPLWRQHWLILKAAMRGWPGGSSHDTTE